MTSRYRSQIRIYVDILKLIQTEREAKLTRILYGANLSYDRLMKYLQYLKNTSLIEEDKSEADLTIYMLTQKGNDFLKEFRKVEEFSEAFGISI